MIVNEERGRVFGSVAMRISAIGDLILEGTDDVDLGEIISSAIRDGDISKAEADNLRRLMDDRRHGGLA